MSVSAGVLLYQWIIGGEERLKKSEGSLKFAQLSLESILEIKDEYLDTESYALMLTLRNIGKTEACLPTGNLYAYRGDTLVAKATAPLIGGKKCIKPGDTITVRYFFDKNIAPGKLRLVLRGEKGGFFQGTCELKSILHGSVYLKVSATNDEDHKAILSSGSATFVAWLEQSGESYKVYFSVTPKPSVWLKSYRAELFNSTGYHPRWVGGNPYHYTGSPFTYPDNDTEYWIPVSASELPVMIVFTLYEQ